MPSSRNPDLNPNSDSESSSDSLDDQDNSNHHNSETAAAYSLEQFLVAVLSGIISSIQNIPLISLDDSSHSTPHICFFTSSNAGFFDCGNILPDSQITKIEKKLQDIFSSTKCEVIDLDKEVVIRFTYNTTDETLAGYAAILNERYGIPPEKIQQKSAWDFKTLEFPANLRLALNLTELHDKLGCGQELMKCPDKREQQLIKYSPPCRP